MNARYVCKATHHLGEVINRLNPEGVRVISEQGCWVQLPFHYDEIEQLCDAIDMAAPGITYLIWHKTEGRELWVPKAWLVKMPAIAKSS